MEKSWTYEQLQLIAQYGETPKGVSRLAFTPEDVEARNFVLNLMKRIGLAVRVDAFGNIFARLEGLEDLPPVAAGSHLDTVPDGGNFDGILGVIGALEAIRELKARGPMRRPVEVIVFAAEESSRFGYATMGSKLLCGKLSNEVLNNIQDQYGVKLSTALQACGYDSGKLSETKRQKGDWAAFIELHIEQGPVLDKDGISIGIVEAIAAPTRLKVEITGVANHSGATPMDRRYDALVSAAHLVLAVEQAAVKEMSNGTVGTVGTLTVLPGVMNVVPGQANLAVDIRGINYASVQRVKEQVIKGAEQLTAEKQTKMEVNVLSSEQPVMLDPKICSLIEQGCQRLGLSYQRMPSGAGHDAMYMAELAPTGMIFIPCQDGISHNGAEFASEKAVAEGVALLTEVLYQLAK